MGGDRRLLNRVNNSQEGFTLVELIITIAIIAILAGVVVFFINPGNSLGSSRNSQRRVDTTSLLNAVHQYNIDNGDFPSGIPTGTASVIGTASSGCSSACTATTTNSSCLDLSGDLVPAYLATIPFDPLTGSATNTDYYILENSSGRIVVGACDPDQDADIKFVR